MTDEYTVRHVGGCLLIFGAVPASAFAGFAKMLPAKAVMNPDIARMAGANFAMGLAADLDALKVQFAPDALAKAKRDGPGLSDDMQRWLAMGQRGSSSETIFQHLTGVVIRGESKPAHPYDPDDMKRCRLLLEQCPTLVAAFPRMRDASPVWARLVDAWSAICAAMDEESPQWREGKGHAPRTYALMKDALQEQAA